MGTNYYITLCHAGINASEYSVELCHVGRNQHLDFMSLCRFLLNLIPEDHADQLRLRAVRKLVKTGKETEHLDKSGLFDFLVHCFEHYADESYTCHDEYGKPRVFRDVLKQMRTGSAGEFSVGATPSQTQWCGSFTCHFDGFWLDLDTGFS